jgi:hypothetical protein
LSFFHTFLPQALWRGVALWQGAVELVVTHEAAEDALPPVKPWHGPSQFLLNREKMRKCIGTSTQK